MPAAKTPEEKLQELIKDIKFAMFTTCDEDGSLRSRPMATQETQFDGTLWFFTSEPSGKTAEVHREQHVNISYAHPKEHRYVSVSGLASIVRDKSHMKSLWTPMHRAWFPEGLNDPHLALIKVQVEKAEYWTSPSNPVAQILHFAKALIRGKSFSAGEHEKLNLNQPKPEQTALH